MAGGVGVRLDRLVHRTTTFSGLAAEGVDHAQEQVAAEVLEVAPVAEPGAGGRDVVGGALALSLEEDGQLEEVLAVPCGEGLEELEALTVGVDDDFDTGAVLGRGQEALVASLEPALGQRLSVR